MLVTNNDSIQFSNRVFLNIAIFLKHISCFSITFMFPTSDAQFIFPNTPISTNLYLPIIFNSTKRIGGYETSVNAEASQKPMSLPPTFSASGPTYHA